MPEIEDVLRRVQALLAKAESTEFPAEAESLRALAEQLMWKHRIDEAMFREASTSVLDPGWREWPVCSAVSEYSLTYWGICSAIVNHFDLRAVRKSNGREHLAEACGYEGELRMAETTYTEFRLAFATRLEPRFDPSKSEQVNAYVLRSAGLEGRRIAEMMYGQNTKALRSKVRNMFKREAEARGEDPRQLLGDGPVKNFRADFADGFLTATWSRLAQMRRARGDAETGLVLASTKERVEEQFYARYPDLRPRQRTELGLDGAANSRANCARCAKAQSGYCRDHAWLKPRKVKMRSMNYAAYERGGDAARSVDLGASRGRRLEG